MLLASPASRVAVCIGPEYDTVGYELVRSLRAAERVTSMQRELIRLATTDSLTGVLNRRAFFARSQLVCDRAAAGVPISTIMLDIDHFKRINDDFGHHVGDAVLAAFAQACAGRLRSSDRLGRYGGEEFLLVLPG